MTLKGGGLFGEEDAWDFGLTKYLRGDPPYCRVRLGASIHGGKRALFRGPRKGRHYHLGRMLLGPWLEIRIGSPRYEHGGFAQGDQDAMSLGIVCKRVGHSMG